MTLYEKNLAFLISQGFEPNLLQQESSDGEPTLNLFKGHKGFYTATKQGPNGSILLHSAYDPQFEAQRALAAEDYTKYLAVFMFGLGLGYNLVELLKQTRPDCLIFVIESDWEIIRAAMHVVDFSEILESHRVVLAIGSPQEIRVILDRLFIIREVIVKLHNMGFLYFAPKYRTEFEWVKEVRRLVLETFRYHRNAMGIDIGWTISGLRNLTEHVPYIARSPFPNIMKNSWNRPVVICLAGPSLNKNIHVLKEWQDKVTIFCVNTSFNKLLDHGIIPDATFSLDRTPLIPEKHYYRETPIPESIVFIANPVVDPRSVHLFKHYFFVFGGGEVYEWELANAIGSQLLPAGLSVTHMAFTFSQYIGASPIILIGQDLALGEAGETHSLGTVYERDKINPEHPELIHVEGYYGGTVPTTRSWKFFKDWYEMHLESNPWPAINATEGGAYIKGMEHISLREALEKYVGMDAPQKPSFTDWVISMREQFEGKYAEILEKIRNSFAERALKLQIHEHEMNRALRLCQQIGAGATLAIQNDFLQKVLHIINQVIAGDSWVYSAYRPEYVRILAEYEALNGETDAGNILTRAGLLQGMAQDLGKFLGELRNILEHAVAEINEELGTS